MGIDAYLSHIKAVIDRYAAATFVISASTTFDIRPGDQGYLSGAVRFVDGSTLFFREYLNVEHDAVEKVMYSHHYQDAAGRMILRYDNAAHRPSPQSFEHKHDATDVRETTAPDLEDVLSEIAVRQGWTR